MELVLSLFPGIGLLDMAFEAESFCVVRGPDLLWGGDIHRFHPPAGKFDGVIGGPPCQAFSRLNLLVRANGLTVAANLIPEFERVVKESAPRWFLMENVPGAPLPQVDGYAVQERLLNARWVGSIQDRTRRFTFGVPNGTAARFRLDEELVVFEPVAYEPPALASGGQPDGVERTSRAKATRKGASALGYKTAAYLKRAIRAQELPEDFLRHAPFTVAGKIKAVGNGVPLPMGRAVARAVKRALEVG